MSEYLSFEDLVSEELETEDVKITNGVVQVKALTRFEYTLALKNANQDGQVDMTVLEANLIRFGMVTPKLDEAKAQKWMKSASAGTVNPVLEAIRRLSNLSNDAEKSNVRDLREES